MSYDAAFIEAYRSNVAVAPKDVVKTFMSRYHEDHNIVYKDYSEYYTSIMDALGMFEAGIQFAKEKT